MNVDPEVFLKNLQRTRVQDYSCPASKKCEMPDSGTVYLLHILQQMLEFSCMGINTVVNMTSERGVVLHL
jgi:hypothetical protein